MINLSSKAHALYICVAMLIVSVDDFSSNHACHMHSWYFTELVTSRGTKEKEVVRQYALTDLLSHQGNYIRGH